MNTLQRALFDTESPKVLFLGLLLFCIFINDLPLHITSDAVNFEMFTDDTSLNASDKTTATVQNELQKSINEISDWCDKNAMILHPAKAKSVLQEVICAGIEFQRDAPAKEKLVLNRSREER